MNEYLDNAIYNLRRSSSLLSPKMTNESIEDGLVLFAFGIERICKAILFSVNPLFLLESDSFDNAVGVVYRNRLIPNYKDKAEKEVNKPTGLNRNLLPFKGSMLRAARFSQSVEDNIGAFTKLSDLRGIIAHRPLSELNHAEAHRFILRLFSPIIERFAKELGFAAKECFSENSEQLAKLSKEIVAEDAMKERLDKLFAEHRKKWEDNKKNEAFVAKAQRETEAAFINDPNLDSFAEEYQCPACGNSAILFIEADWDVEGSSGEGFITGVYVSGLECRYCELELNDYEEFDYLRLNERLA